MNFSLNRKGNRNKGDMSVERRAKASTRGSIQGWTDGLGRFVRGAFAIQDASGDAGGRGTSSRSPRLLVAVAAAFLLILALGATLAYGTAAVVTIKPVTTVTYTTATVEGELTPDSEAGQTYVFAQYAIQGTDHGGSGEENWQQAGFGGESAGPVSRTIANLKGGTTYEVRLGAVALEGPNASQNQFSSTEEFTTKEVPPPVVVIHPVTGITGSSANFSGTVNPNAPEAEPTSAEVEASFHTQWRFECEPGCDGGEGELAADNSAHTVEHEPHLFIHPNQHYTLKLTAENAGGKTVAETTFTTPKVTAAVNYVPSAPVSRVNDTEARMQGTIDPRESGDITDCHFIYGAGGNLDHETPCVARNEVQFVELAAEGGQYRLLFEGEETGDIEFDASSETVEVALEALATIGPGNVNVKGGPGGHFFERPYVVTFEGALGSTNVPQMETGIGTEPLGGLETVQVNTQVEGGTAIEAVSTHQDRDTLVAGAVSGLAPETEYSFRLVTEDSTGPSEGATNRFVTFKPPPAEPSSCPNEAIRVEQQATKLPDCRAWEMVSPVDKNGGNIELEGWNAPGANDGSAITYLSRGSFADTQGSGVIGLTSYISELGPNGWETHATMPVPSPNQDAIFGPITTPRWFSDDLTHSVIMSYDLPKVTDDISQGVNDYWENLRTRELMTISKPPYFEEPTLFDFWYQGTGPWSGATSKDERIIAFPMRTRLLEEAPPGAESIYEWEEGKLRLASILPNGSPASEASVSPDPGTESGTKNWVSSDGSLVAFMSPKEGQKQLYVRRNHTDSVWVSEPEGSGPVTAPEGVQLQYITPDNKHLLFTTTSQLLDEDTNSQTDLYEYTDGPDPASEHNLQLISSGEATEHSVGTVLGTSSNGDHVYYLSEACCGQPDLFLWKNGSRRLLLTNPDLSGEGGAQGGVNADDPGTRVSADGKHLVFMATGKRSYYEGNRGLNGEIRIEPEQLYVYDDSKEMLFCASCAQSRPGDEGEATTVSSALHTPFRVNDVAKLGDSFDTGVGYVLQHQVRYLTSDGARVFFSTVESLVPQDKNENFDAYEYDIETGKQRLLTTGRGEKPQVFAEASADGSTIWFATKTPVLPRDPDKLRDIYASRVGGGFVEPPPPTACVGDGCRGPIPAPPTDPSPSTPRFSGPGNPKPKHVKPRHHRKKHHRKHHHRRHGQGGGK